MMYSYFNTHLPIQLDATCNGYQHLSMLSRDNKLAVNLNLLRCKSTEIPKDFYSILSHRILELILK